MRTESGGSSPGMLSPWEEVAEVGVGGKEKTESSDVEDTEELLGTLSPENIREKEKSHTGCQSVTRLMLAGTACHSVRAGLSAKVTGQFPTCTDSDDKDGFAVVSDVLD